MPKPIPRQRIKVRQQVIEPGKKIRVYPTPQMKAKDVETRLADKLFAKFRNVNDAVRVVVVVVVVEVYVASACTDTVGHCEPLMPCVTSSCLRPLASSPVSHV